MSFFYTHHRHRLHLAFFDTAPSQVNESSIRQNISWNRIIVSSSRLNFRRKIVSFPAAKQFYFDSIAWRNRLKMELNSKVPLGRPFQWVNQDSDRLKPSVIYWPIKSSFAS